jgi:hypothetical protein
MRLWFVLVIAFLITACASQSTTLPVPTVEVTVEPMVEPFVEPTATPDCLHADGVTFNVRRISDSGMELHVSGLEPGEVPYVTYSTSNSGSSLRGEAGKFAQGANAKGEFIFKETGLHPLTGQTSATWDIRFIHARGVECATITLP